MRIAHSLISLVLAVSFCHSLYAATITVSPGTDTLSTAISNAEEGDVLVLLSGVYTESSTLQLTKGLTLKGTSNDDKPVLSSIGITFSTPDEADAPFVMQGVSFVGGFFSVSNSSRISQDWGNVSFLQNDITNTQINFMNLSGSVPSFLNLTFVGNDYSNNRVDTPFWLFARENLYFAGNTFKQFDRSRDSSIYETRFSGRDCYLMGNQIENAIHRDVDSITVRCTRSLIYGNRFDAYANGSAFQERARLLWVRGGANNIKNNVFGFVEGFVYADSAFEDTVRLLGLANTVERSSTVSNNIFDFSNEPEPEDAGSRSAITTNNEISVYNNIFYEFEGYSAFEPSSTLNTLDTKQYNLCYNGGTCIEGSTNITADPEFTDLTSYALGEDSAAMNAGSPLVRFNDVDGTRNDIGVQGGTFPYSQYQSQLADSDKPFIYPLFEAAGRIAPDNQLVVDILAVARNQ